MPIPMDSLSLLVLGWRHLQLRVSKGAVTVRFPGKLEKAMDLLLGANAARDLPLPHRVARLPPGLTGRLTRMPSATGHS